MSEFQAYATLAGVLMVDVLVAMGLVRLILTDIEMIKWEKERNKKLDVLAGEWERLAEFLDTDGVHPLEKFLEFMRKLKWKKVRHDMGIEEYFDVDA